MKYRKKQDAVSEDVKVFENFGDFSKDKYFVTRRVGLKISSYDNKGDVMQVDTPSGKLIAYKGDVVVKDAVDGLHVYKSGIFSALYEPYSVDEQNKEESDARERICRMILERIEGKTSVIQIEKTIKMLGGIKDSEKKVESEETSTV